MAAVKPVRPTSDSHIARMEKSNSDTVPACPSAKAALLPNGITAASKTTPRTGPANKIAGNSTSAMGVVVSKCLVVRVLSVAQDSLSHD